MGARSHLVQAYIGDTFHHVGHVVDPLPGFQTTKPMVRPFPVMLVLLLTAAVRSTLGYFPWIQTIFQSSKSLFEGSVDLATILDNCY